MIKTSVIIPIYNTEKYLKECIESVLKQTQIEIEIILVDDGSTDYSKDIIDSYGKKYSNIIVIHQENQKLGVARNVGLRIAKGEYVYFLDSDDMIDNNLLDKCYELTKKNDLDFLMFDAKSFIEQGINIDISNVQNNYNRTKVGIKEKVYTGKEFWMTYYNKRGILVNAVLVYTSRRFLLENELFFLGGIYYEDNDWMLRMLLKAKRIMYLPYMGYNRRYRRDSITTIDYNVIHLTSCFKIIGFLWNLYCWEEDNYGKNMISQMVISIVKKLEDICKAMIEIKAPEVLNKDMEFFLGFVYHLILREDSSSYEILFILERCCIRIRKSILKSGMVVPYESILTEINHLWVEEVKNHYKLHLAFKMGIYGTGKICDDLINWFLKNGIEIKAELSFITSDNEVCEYRNCLTNPVSQVRKLELDYIIIASTKYKDEMLNNLHINGVDSNKIIQSYGYLS